MMKMRAKQDVSSMNWLAGLALGGVRRTGALVPLTLVLIVAFGLSSKHFLTAHNFETIFSQTVYFVLVVVAQALVMIGGGFDLSVGASVALTSIVTSLLLLGMPPGIALGVAVIGGVGTGMVVGAVNGFIVSTFRISPLIVTLGTASAVSGLALIITGGAPLFDLPSSFSSVLYRSSVGGIPTPWVITVLLLLMMHALMYWHRQGRYWYAVGGNAEAAYVAGVPVGVSLFLAYTVAGILVGVGGVLLTARVGSGEPSLGGTLPLQSIAAAVLGGVSLRGGEGSIWGAALGGLLLILLTNGLDVVGVSSYLEMVVIGGLVIFAMIVDRYVHA